MHRSFCVATGTTGGYYVVTLGGWLKYSLLLILLITCWVVAFNFGTDAAAYYKVVAWIQQGQLEKIYAPDGKMRWFYYGPVALPFFKVMTPFSFPTAQKIWISIHTLAFGLFWYSLYQLFPTLKGSRFSLGWLLVFVVAINPIHTNFQCQNVQLIFGSLLLFSELLSHKGSKILQVASGFLCMLLAAIKLYPLFIVAFYLLKKSWWVRLGLTMGLIYSVLAPFAFFGTENAMHFFKGFWANLSIYHGLYTLDGHAENLSLVSFLSVWLPQSLKIKASWLPTGLVLILSASFFIWMLRLPKQPSQQNEIYFWALAMALMALLNSSSRPDHFIAYVPAFCVLVEQWQTQQLNQKTKMGTLLSLSLIAFTTEFVVGSKAINNWLELMRIPVLGMILLCLLLTLQLSRTDTP